MNILFLTTHLNTGGITSYLLTMSKGLIRRGHQVHVASSGGNMAKEFQAHGVKLKNLNIRTKSELDPRIYFALGPIARYIRENKIDLIHSQTRITQVMGRILKKRTGQPYLSTCHGFFTPRLSRKFIPCWGDAVIAISKEVKAHLKDDFNVAEEKICLIENGIDLDEFSIADKSTKERGRARFNLGPEPVLGIVARLSDVKGQDVLIEAMKHVAGKMADIKLLIVGKGRTEAMLRKKVDDLNLSEHVRFFSIVDKTSEMLSLFDVFVLPSRQEGLGLSIMEAQAAGLPVIASRVGGIPSLIEHGRTGILVEPGDPRALAGAIVGLFQDPVRLHEIGMAGREFIEKNYSSDKMVEEVIRLYQILVKGQR